MAIFLCKKNDDFLGFGEDWNDGFIFFWDVWIKMIKMIKVRLPGIWLWSFQRFQRFQVHGVQGPDLPGRGEACLGGADFMSGAS